ncbi:MAG: hypothetical protein V4671_13590, partial [Armatimonadota bacterium]
MKLPQERDKIGANPSEHKISPYVASSQRNSLKIAVVTPAVWHSSDPGRFSINLHVYVQALQKLGYESLLICPEESVIS